MGRRGGKDSSEGQAAPGLLTSTQPWQPACALLWRDTHTAAACAANAPACLPPAAAGRAVAQGGGCIAAGQQVLGACSAEQDAIATVFPLAQTQPATADELRAAVAALKNAQLPKPG